MSKQLCGFKAIIIAMGLGLAAVSPAYAQSQQAARADQLEQCGLFARTAPWCHEALEVDTRQLQSAQIFSIQLSPQAQAEWQRVNRDRRGIAFSRASANGGTEITGRRVIMAVHRVFLFPPAGVTAEPLLLQAVAREDGSALVVFLPAEGNFVGWSAYIPSAEGRYLLTTAGEVVRLSGRHREDGNLDLDRPRLPASTITGTLPVTEGDGSRIIETLEETFTDHVLVRDRDGQIRVYSGLPGTFTPLSPESSSVAAMHTNCRTVGQRLEARGNLRVDTGSIAGAVATSGISLIPQVAQNIIAVFDRSCR